MSFPLKNQFGYNLRWLRTEIPQAEIRTTDFIPRESEGGKFVMCGRQWNNRVERLDSKHRHVAFWRVYVNESRGFKLKNGIGNRATASSIRKCQERPPSNAKRFSIWHFLFREDKIHLSQRLCTKTDENTHQ